MTVSINYLAIASMKAYTTMSTICSSTLLGCLVDLDVLDNEVSGIKTLGIRICLCILEETEEEFGRLDGPSCARYTELLSYNIINADLPQRLALSPPISVHTLCSTSGPTSVSSHGNSLLVCLDILEECNSSTQLPSVDRLGRFPGVLLFTSAPSSAGIGNTPYLEGNPQVGTASPRRLGWVYLGGGVADLDNSSISISPSRRFWKLDLMLRIAVHSSLPRSCQHLDSDWS